MAPERAYAVSERGWATLAPQKRAETNALSRQSSLRRSCDSFAGPSSGMGRACLLQQNKGNHCLPWSSYEIQPLDSHNHEISRALLDLRPLQTANLQLRKILDARLLWNT